MSICIESLQEAVEQFICPEMSLFGMRFIVDTVGEELSEETEVSFQSIGMFSMAPGNVVFRTRMTVRASVVKELWIDVAVGYVAPTSYSVTKKVFLDFANQIAMPQLRNYAQALLNPLLVSARYPANILPPTDALDEVVFRGDELPNLLGPADMGSLRGNPSLAVPEPLPSESGLLD